MDQKMTDWLQHLQATSDEDAGRQSLAGRAVSRSETHLHFATADGVLAIPLDDINDVEAPFLDDLSRVRLTLRSSRNITRIRRPVRLRQSDPGPIIIVGPGVNTTVCTTTYTGEGDETMCDDDGCVDSADDLAQ